MVSWTMRTARSLSSAGCWCPDPCLGVCCFDADMGYILPKNAASIKPRAVHFGRFEFNSKASPGLWVRFRPPESPELLHELLHGICAARRPGDVSVGSDHSLWVSERLSHAAHGQSSAAVT